MSFRVRRGDATAHLGVVRPYFITYFDDDGRPYRIWERRGELTEVQREAAERKLNANFWTIEEMTW